VRELRADKEERHAHARARQAEAGQHRLSISGSSASVIDSEAAEDRLKLARAELILRAMEFKLGV